MPEWIIAIILGLVEGLTEFLPVSSTGHLIVAGYGLGFTGEFAQTFEIVIQLGAIMAVVFHYHERIASLIKRFPTDRKARNLIFGIALAFLPAAVVGLLAHRMIRLYLFTPASVGAALIVGGVAILIIESIPLKARALRLEGVDFRMALSVGIAQCLALFPGISRSGATIMGGLLAGMDRKTAMEFSFFLALPTMFAATLYDGYTNRDLLFEENFMTLLIGFSMSFITARIVIAWFLGFIRSHTFRIFGYYRIVFGIILLAIFWGD